MNIEERQCQRIKMHYDRQLWGFYTEGDLIILKKIPPPPEGMEDSHRVPSTFVTRHYQDDRLMSEDWSEVLPRVVSLGITADIAFQGVEYLKQGGEQLVLNIFSNSIVLGKKNSLAVGEKTLEGEMTGYPMSEEEKAQMRANIADLNAVKIEKKLGRNGPWIPWTDSK